MSESLSRVVTDALDELKARDVRVLDVGALTSIMDTMIVASGTSDRHVRALADRVVEATRASGVKPLGVEGADQGEWVLVDLGDVVLHLMQPQVREHYQIEKLWDSGRIGGGAVSERR